MRNLTAADRKSLLRLASDLPVGDATRREVLAHLKTASEVQELARNLEHWDTLVSLSSLQKAFGNMSDILLGLSTSDPAFDRRIIAVASELRDMSESRVKTIQLPDGLKPWDFMEKSRGRHSF